jgi:Ca2+-binding RTX toxin-like protein
VLSQGESVLVDGEGSQLGGKGRWGDYASLSVDPADDCTFWFTSECYSSTSGSNWATRIGSFTFPSCDTSGTPSGLSVFDVTIAEGNSGNSNAVFPVTLSPAQAGETITVDYATSAGTATAGTDYTTTSGTLSFAPNDMTENISVPVSGDLVDEANETFTVILSNASGGTTLTDGQGIGTITNDDSPVGSCTITGTAGDDIIYGTSGNDVICGLGGADRLFGQAGNDVLDGGPGLDRVDFSSATGGVTVHIGNGTAVGAGNSGTDTLISISDAVGSKFADTMTGDGGSNWFFASAGNDTLSGLGGNDRLRGQAGNDTIMGGTGTDNCAQGRRHRQRHRV